MANLQFESSYKEFFGLICYNEYYKGLLCRDLVFEPTQETLQQLRNYYLNFKALDFGFIVTYSPEMTPQRLRMAPQKMRFSFRIQSRNRNFVNFSDIPFQADFQAFHFSNIHESSVEVEREIPREVYYYFKHLNVANSEKKLLHLPEYHEVILKPRRHNFDIINEGISGEAASYNDLKVVDEWGEELAPNGVPLKKEILEVKKSEVDRFLYTEKKKLLSKGLSLDEINEQLIEIRGNVGKTLASQESTGHAVDLRHSPYGKYTIGIRGAGKEKAIYVSDAPDERVFGVVDLHLDANNTNALLNRDGTTEEEVMQPQLFHLYFKARETYWRYFFINHKGSKISPVKLKEEYDRITFTEPIEGILDNLGTRAMIAESVHPVPLRDRPEYVINLERAIGKRSFRELRLPFPSVDLIKPIKKDGERKIYSDVFVYL